MTSPAHHHHQHHSSVNELANNIDAYGDHIQSAQVHFCFFSPNIFVVSSFVVCTNCINKLYNKVGCQFNERLLLWQPSGIFLYSTVIVFICFLLCWRVKYDDDQGTPIQVL